MKSLLIVNIIAQKISLTIQILIAIPELPVYGLPEIFPVRTVTPVCIVMGLFLYSSRRISRSSKAKEVYRVLGAQIPLHILRGDHNGRYPLPMPFHTRYLGYGLVDYPSA